MSTLKNILITVTPSAAILIYAGFVLRLHKTNPSSYWELVVACLILYIVWFVIYIKKVKPFLERPRENRNVFVTR